jgi:hypothetical protein
VRLLCRASNQTETAYCRFQKESPAACAGLSLRTYYSPVKSLRANLTAQGNGKAWPDGGDKMAKPKMGTVLLGRPSGSRGIVVMGFPSPSQ